MWSKREPSRALEKRKEVPPQQERRQERVIQLQKDVVRAFRFKKVVKLNNARLE
jgi:hypothetical protein